LFIGDRRHLCISDHQRPRSSEPNRTIVVCETTLSCTLIAWQLARERSLVPKCSVIQREAPGLVGRTSRSSTSWSLTGCSAPSAPSEPPRPLRLTGGPLRAIRCARASLEARKPGEEVLMVGRRPSTKPVSLNPFRNAASMPAPASVGTGERGLGFLEHFGTGDFSPATFADCRELARFISLAGGGLYEFLFGDLIPLVTPTSFLAVATASRRYSISYRNCFVAVDDAANAIIGVANVFPTNLLRKENHAVLPFKRRSHIRPMLELQAWGSMFLNALAVGEQLRCRGARARAARTVRHYVAATLARSPRVMARSTSTI